MGRVKLGILTWSQVPNLKVKEANVFVEEGDNFADLTCPRGHRFCAKCDNGPHPAMTCDARRNQLQEEQSFSEAFRQALRLGWKPCPQRCKYGGGYKSQEECDHVTCECGFEFCWDCGVDRRVPLAHDNRSWGPVLGS
ncbi:ARI10 [Symbiodinium sp. KB8]|nr:ARI10 [Symbiodinium sp. KB8]